MLADDSSVAKKLSKLKVGQRLDLVVTEVKADGSAVFSGPRVSDLTVIANHSQLGGTVFIPLQLLFDPLYLLLPLK